MSRYLTKSVVAALAGLAVACGGSGSSDSGKISLTVTKTGAGTVTSTPAGINCGATCTAQFDKGTVVTLTAAATDPASFEGWAGGCTGTAATCTVTLSSAATVTATFSGAATGTNLIAQAVASMSDTSTSSWSRWGQSNPNGESITTPTPDVTSGAGSWDGTMEVTSTDYGTASTTHDGVDATDHAWYSQVIAGDGSGAQGTYHLQVGKTYQAKIKAASTVPDQTIELVIQVAAGQTDQYKHWLTFPVVPTATLTEYASPTFTVDVDVPAVWFVIGLGGNGTSGAVFHLDDAALLEQ